MLEFSTLGHEEAADIPQFVHPRIPNEVRLHFRVPLTLWYKNRRLVRLFPGRSLQMKCLRARHRLDVVERLLG